jgi:hypothetical protein
MPIVELPLQGILVGRKNRGSVLIRAPPEEGEPRKDHYDSGGDDACEGGVGDVS